MVDADCPPVAQERRTYTPISEPGTAPPAARKFGRYALFATVLGAFAVLTVDKVVQGFIEGFDHSGPQKAPPSMRGAVELMAVGEQMNAPQVKPYRPDSGCKDDGSICVCTEENVVIGEDALGYNQFQPQIGATACQMWKFKVGDMIFVEKPSGDQHQYPEANIVAKVTGSPVVHTAIVTQIPVEGVRQTAENVIVTEALKGQWKKVLQNRFRVLIERYPFGGISLRRVDEKKYPDFFTPAAAAKMTAWANSVLDQPFDTTMVNPAKKRLFTKGRYINPDTWGGGPNCDERNRAVQMYNAGGPGKFICTQLVAWTIAFAGGLNTNPKNVDGQCAVPAFTVKDLQPNPGDMLKVPWVGPGNWHIPCGTKGCYIAVPNIPQWSGGTTTTTTFPVFVAEGSSEVAAATPPDGDWSVGGGHVDAVIKGTTVTVMKTKGSEEIELELTHFTGTAFQTQPSKAKDKDAKGGKAKGKQASGKNYGGGAASYGPDNIIWSSGEVWTRVQEKKVVAK